MRQELHFGPSIDGAVNAPQDVVDALVARGLTACEVPPSGRFWNDYEAAAQLGELAAANGIVLHELSPQRGSLEEAFMELTKADVQFHSPDAIAQATNAQAAPASASATQGGGA